MKSHRSRGGRMRDIKFRVYDKHLKVIRDVVYIDFDNKEIMYWIDDEQNMGIVRSFDESG